MKKLKTDVAIAGAGTAGTFLSLSLARRGIKCVVLESRALHEVGREIGPFHMEEIAFEKFSIPKPEGDEILHRIERMTVWSPRLKNSVTFKFPTFVMDKNLFVRRLHEDARNKGVELIEKTKAKGVLFENGKLTGILAESGGEEIKISAKLIVDATGVAFALRGKMPPSPWLETESLSPNDFIFVYMETWKDVDGDFTLGVDSFPYFLGWRGPAESDRQIIGAGMGGSPEAAKKRHEKLRSILSFKGTPIRATEGRIPYRRSPFSLVDDRFACVGDAAFMNKPFSGEGVTSGFEGARILAEVVEDAFGKGDFSRKSLWDYNLRYHSGQGAKFAFISALLPALVSMDIDEMEFFFGIPGVLTEEGSVLLHRDFEIKSNPRDLPKTTSATLAGLIGRKVRIQTLAKLGLASLKASRIRRHYEEYPEKLQEFEIWKMKAQRLWRKPEEVRIRYFESFS